MAKPTKVNDDSTRKTPGRSVIQPESHEQIDIVYTPRSYFTVSNKVRGTDKAKKAG